MGDTTLASSRETTWMNSSLAPLYLLLVALIVEEYKRWRGL
jgi:hypothetical protein